MNVDKMRRQLERSDRLHPRWRSFGFRAGPGRYFLWYDEVQHFLNTTGARATAMAPDPTSNGTTL